MQQTNTTPTQRPAQRPASKPGLKPGQKPPMKGKPKRTGPSFEAQVKANFRQMVAMLDALKAKLPKKKPTAAAAAQVAAASPLAKPQGMWLIGHRSDKVQSQIVIGAGLVLVALASIIGTGTYAISERVTGVNAELASTMVLSQSLRSDMEAASNGTIQSFRQGDLTKRELRSILSDLRAEVPISDEITVALPPMTVAPRWDDGLWRFAEPRIFDESRNTTDAVKLLWQVHALADQVGLYEPALQSFMDAVTRARDAAADMVVAAASDSRIGPRMIRSTSAARDSVAEVFATRGEANAIAASGRAIQSVKAALKELTEAEQTTPTALQIRDAVKSAEESMSVVLSQTYGITIPTLRETTATLTDTAGKYTASAESIINAGMPRLVKTGWTITGLLATLALLSLMLLARISSHASARNAFIARSEQEETDSAIIRMMQELRGISGGDLVGRLTVTEHVTGSIADRVNLMTENTQDALEAVKGATADAERSMETIFELIEQANDTSEVTQDEAKSSKEMALAGAEAVARAVGKMNEARSKIQEVSKRVKNLGEVAQSIASVTELIEQLTEKTKVLALNTSLIASEAGEQGAKYRTLAKEINKMSDDTTRSLTQISAAVESMQTETQNVITTVEGVTSEVVASSHMWDEALAALDKITKSSEQIEALVTTLRQSTSDQASSASDAVQVMGRLSESARKFRTNSNEAALQED